MKLNAPRIALVSIASLTLFAGASCTSQSEPAVATKSQPAGDDRSASAKLSGGERSNGQGTRTVAIREGEAGGAARETFTTSATVRSIDASTRNITLTRADGSIATIVAPPEVRNFDQIHVGDTVTATIVETIYVFVPDGNNPKSITHSAALARAPKGAKPGALVGEAYEITATVKSIDLDTREVSLEFVDGSTRKVTPRPDVELTRYKAGDTLVIQVSQVLSVLVTETK